MKFRAVFLMCLLALQPVGALASAWASPPEDGVMSHCETTETAEEVQSSAEDRGSLPDTGDAHSDCEEDCGLCAACGSALAELTLDEVSFCGSESLGMTDDFLPPGLISSLYRPPILT